MGDERADMNEARDHGGEAPVLFFKKQNGVDFKSIASRFFCLRTVISIMVGTGFSN